MRFLTKRVAAPGDFWSWSEDAFPPISFCVRALVLDGLAVPPFDRHGDGDGRLRELGLDLATWQAWVASILRQQGILGDRAPARGTPEAPGPLLEQERAAAEVLSAPGSLCPGSEELRARLGELSADYAIWGQAWKRRLSDARRLHGSPRQQRALWKALEPFHDLLPTLSVYFVEYAEPVVMPLPPTTCLIAPEDRPDRFRRQVVAAADALAALGRTEAGV